MKRLKIILLSSLFLIAAGQLIAQNLPDAIDFTLENLNGEEVTLSDYYGQGPVLISFWATWCKPCKQELPKLNELYKKYSDKGFQVFALSVDAEKSVAKVKPYVEAHGFEFPVLLDTDGETARDYYAQVVPYSVLINKDGKIVWSHMGYKRGDEIELEKLIKKLLKKKK